MKISERLEQLLILNETAPTRDAAKIITPSGVDAKAKITAIKECIRLAKEIETNGLIQHTNCSC